MARPQKPKIFEMDIEISTLDRKVGAYTIEHLPTGAVYHGSTIHLYRRVIEHQNDLKGDKHGNSNLQKLYKEGGDLKLSFHPTSSAEEAIRKEQELIDKTPKELLLNASFNAANTAAGMWENPVLRESISRARIGNKNAAGTEYTAERRAKQSQVMKGNQHLLGHHHSEESRAKMSASRKGRKCSSEHTAASAEGRTRERAVIDGIEYQNAAVAGKALGMSTSGVKKRCKSDKFPNWKLVPKVQV